MLLLIQNCKKRRRQKFGIAFLWILFLNSGSCFAPSVSYIVLNCIPITRKKFLYGDSKRSLLQMSKLHIWGNVTAWKYENRKDVMECHFSRWKVRQTQIFLYLYFIYNVYICWMRFLTLWTNILCWKFSPVENCKHWRITFLSYFTFYCNASQICEKVHASSDIGVFRMNCVF
jgi:hypothetical protein